MFYLRIATIATFVALLALSTKGVTIEEVQQHSSSGDCWSAIYGVVYDFTDYGESHTFAGGPQRVWDSCGKDFTDEFDEVHGDSPEYLQWAGIVEIGELTDSPSSTALPTTTDESTTPTTTVPGTTTTASDVPATTSAFESSTPATSTTEASMAKVTIVQVQEHSSSSDCWSAIYGKVYDFTNYGESHTFAGGPQRVWDSCGKDFTNEFDEVHADNPEYLQWAGIVEIGELVESSTGLPSSTDEASTTTTTTTTTTTAPLTTMQPAASQEPTTSKPVPTTPESSTATYTTSLPTTPETQAGITLDELASYDTPEDCLVLFYDYVYNLTEYAYRHPVVGETAIHPYCGVNGTDAFAAVHEKSYLERIEDLIVGPISAPITTPTTAQPDSESQISDEELASHDSPDDCWVAFYDSVYDMTQYAYIHPGPAEEAIHPWCGFDGTTAFDAFHEESLLAKVEYTKVGILSVTTSATSTIRLCGVVWFCILQWLLSSYEQHYARI